MAELPKVVIPTDPKGLASAHPGLASAWEEDSSSNPGGDWRIFRGYVYFRTQRMASGEIVNVPMFRGEAPTLDEPLSNFAGFTQP